MSLYAVNKLCRRVVHEPELRERLRSDPEPALREARPALSEEELHCLLAGDVGRLAGLGASHFLLHQLGRFELFGLTRAGYRRPARPERVPGPAGDSRPTRPERVPGSAGYSRPTRPERAPGPAG